VIQRFLRRIEPFLYSRRNIVGSALALGGLALFFGGLVGGLTWLPIVGGLYLIGVLLVPGEPGLDLRLDAAGDLAAVQSGLDRLLGNVRGKIADDLYARISSIRDAILQILKAEDSSIGAGDPNVYLIRQTALDYLPAALKAYLAVPRLYAERRLLAGGRTPHDVLLEQLTLMDGRMQEVLEDVLRHDSDRLLAQGRFIAEKFARSGLEIAAPDAEEVGVEVSGGTSLGSSDRSAAARTSQAQEQAEARERGR
jgi:hypothetical protein